MKLPLSSENVRLVVAILDRLIALGGRPVLVGGLVPPLLVETFAPHSECELAARATSDCDVAFATDGDAERHQACRAVMSELKFQPIQQFRWKHAGGLLVDAMPVHAGIESADERAVAFARTFVHRDPATFFRGYELALARPVSIALELDDGTSRDLAVAGVTPMLAMKLQAFTDRPQQRRKDARDVVWLARNLAPALIADDLHTCRALRADLVEEIVERLVNDFGDLWARGITAYFEEVYRGRTSYDEEPRRASGANAIAQVVLAYRRLAG